MKSLVSILAVLLTAPLANAGTHVVQCPSQVAVAVAPQAYVVQAAPVVVEQQAVAYVASAPVVAEARVGILSRLKAGRQTRRTLRGARVNVVTGQAVAGVAAVGVATAESVGLEAAE